MRAFRKSFSMFAAAVISLVAASCALFGDEEPSAERNFVEPALTASVRGNVSVSGAAPGVFQKSSARTALPSLNGVSYSVEASGGGRPYVAEVDGENLTFSFDDLAVVEGGTEYAITASGTVSGIEVVSGSCTVTLRPGDALVEDITVKPCAVSESGKVNLTIGIDSGVSESIKSCEISGKGYSKNVAVSGGTITWKSESRDVPAGTYTFSFYDANDVLLYEFRESVLFFGALVTDSWFGSSAYITDGECVITKTLVDKFALSRIYVSSGKEGSKETGTRAEPYKSVARAMNALLDKDTDYTILVDGELAGAQEIPASVTTAKARSITIQGRTGSGTDKINGNNEGTALTIRTAVPVTIKNLKITGGKKASGNGGGIYMASGSNVTLGAGALVGDLTQTTASATSCGNYASYGGGIYNEGSLTLGSGAIVRHNYASPFGGGIWNEGGSVTIKEGAEISYNCAGTSNARGGGIRSGGSGSSLTMAGGTISHNSVSHWGGGVMIQGSEFTMTGGTISFNKSTGSSGIGAGGGGIWIDDGTFKMSGDSILSGNEANNKGGGIHVEHAEATVEILGGTISGNNASVSGGAISNNGVITISGGTIPYGVINASGSLEKGAGKNDVYLPSGKVITVTGALTGTSPVATITPATWTRGTSIVQADGTNVGDISGYKNFFAFSEDGWEWKVSGDKKSLLLDAPVYVASKGTDSSRKVCAAADSFTGTATGSKSKPFATIEDALSVLNAESNVITIDGNVVGNQQILSSKVPSSVTAFTLAGYKGSGDTSSEAKLNGNGSGTVLSVNKSGLEVTVEDLEITGGNFSYGGGLAVDNGTVKLLDGAKITENTATEKGGGVYLGPSAKLVMEGSATISGNTAVNGGGIYNDGNLYLSAGVISKNTASGSGDNGRGGGVYSTGTLFMYGSAVIGDSSKTEVATDSAFSNKAAFGGGIYSKGNMYLGFSSEDTEATLTGGVCYNYANNTGGISQDAGYESASKTFKIASGSVSYNSQRGIYIGKNTFTMTGGTVSGNETLDTVENGEKNGSGIYIGYDTNVVISGGSITANRACLHGGGMYVAQASSNVTIGGGSISSNTAGGNGSGIAVNLGSLKMQGGALVDSDNDVYLASGRTIEITGALTSKTPVATITPASDAVSGTTVLEAGTGVILANEVGKFAVTNNEWAILATGSLVKAETATTLAATLSALPANTVDSPYEIALYASSESDFETIKSILKNNSSKFVNITLYCPGFSSLPESAFSSCTSLVGITLPYGITTIGRYAFISCSNLSSLILPESLKSTSYRDLNGCTALKSIVLPDSLETIDIQSFDSTGLTSITIPKNVKTIGDDAFASSSSLEAVTVDSDNQYFKDIDGVLYNKAGTTLLYYPAAKTGSFVIPNSVTKIGGYSFYHSKLSNLTIPESVTSIGDRAFEACSLTSITLPNSLKTIDSEAFALCSNLTTITIPKSVTSISTSPFSGCSNLTEINVEEGNSKYVSVDGVLFNIDRTLLICYPAGASATSYTIPDTVKTIGTYAFNRCSKLTSITISDSVNYIRSYGIYSCSSLSSIIFTDTTTWYMTSKYSYTDGELVDFTDSATNVTTIKSNYNMYWYKE